MDYKAAIDGIKKLDGGADLASAIEAEVDRLNAKNYEVIGEKRAASSKATAYEAALSAIGKALGVEGDIDAILSGGEGKAKELASSAATTQTKLSEAETRATTAEGKVKTLERASKISSAAAAAGAEAAVLEQLLGDRVDEMAVADGSVKLGDKSLREYVEADPKLKVFLPALFPGGTGGGGANSGDRRPSQPGKLPGAGPTGGTGKKDLLSQYADRAFTGAKVLAPSAAQDD